MSAVDLPQKLSLSLHRGGRVYTPVIRMGQRVELGDSLAQAAVPGGTLHLPSPATALVEDTGQGSGRIVLSHLEPAVTAPGFPPQRPERVGEGQVRDILSRAGIWPMFWSTRTGTVPSLEPDGKPKAIVVNCVLAEPFRARGKVLIERAWDRILRGIRFLPRLLADYGRVEIILTHARDPVARRMYAELAGDAWVRLHSVPVVYPVENHRVLAAAVRHTVRSLKRDDELWLIDVQGMLAVGACLGEGLPLHERVVTTGGPGAVGPAHYAVRIGTPIRAFCPEASGGREAPLVLRGGLLTGEPVGEDDTVGWDDDGFFLLPRPGSRKLLGFARPGFDRTSFLPSFATVLTRVPDRSISTLLRGERRPCIACGLCERVCPAGILPQVIHRYLYREALEDAEKAGVQRCVDCNLCTFVCPSKIELQRQFAEARRRIDAERAPNPAESAAQKEGAR